METDETVKVKLEETQATNESSGQQAVVDPQTNIAPGNNPSCPTSRPQQQPQQPQQQRVCTVPTTPATVSHLSQGPRPMTNQPHIRPHAEYLVLLAPNPRQPGVQGAIRYPIQAMNINQQNIIQANPALIRSINASQIIRAQPSSPGIIQTQTSQAQTSTMANMPTQHLHIPFSSAGPRGPITLSNGQTIMPSIPTILQTPNLLRGSTIQPRMGVHPVIPTSQTMGLGIQTSMGTSSPMTHQQSFNSSQATAPSQMTPGDALAKGTSFFNSLLTRSPKPKKASLQNLTQALIDGKKTSEEFASALQRELESGPQTQLVPFLELLLPTLRRSLNSGQTKLPGIRAPAMMESPQLVPIQTPIQAQPHLALPVSTPIDDSSPSTSSPSKVQSTTPTTKKKRIPPPPGQKTAYAIKKEAREAKKKERESLAASQGIKLEPTDGDKKTTPDKGDKQTKPKADKTKRKDLQKKQEKQLESLSSTLRDDDDVNDVAAMGGVNLMEENQRIMASGAELVGTQIRSCKDEPFLDINVLSAKIARIAKNYDLPEPSKDVVTLVSHATQERLKNLVERLGMLAEHRGENLKLNSKYEVSNDIKGQMKFLAELDRIEKRRVEEQERELLLRVAKSRSKAEDPEQQKLRQKAKDMQRAEQEEVRQREANETALLAIGPRKKLKTGIASSISSFSQSSGLMIDAKPSTLDMRGDTIRRVKRVNMRDLQVLLELDRIYLDRLIKITT